MNENDSGHGLRDLVEILVERAISSSGNASFQPVRISEERGGIANTDSPNKLRA